MLSSLNWPCCIAFRISWSAHQIFHSGTELVASASSAHLFHGSSLLLVRALHLLVFVVAWLLGWWSLLPRVGCWAGWVRAELRAQLAHQQLDKGGGSDTARGDKGPHETNEWCVNEFSCHPRPAVRVADARCWLTSLLLRDQVEALQAASAAVLTPRPTDRPIGQCRTPTNRPLRTHPAIPIPVALSPRCEVA